jgi:cytochrome c-type biogenesis protein
VSGLQELVTGWLTSLGALLPVGFAFGAGMVAAVNPCGFAMLPAYLSLYLGAPEEEFARRTAGARALRALLVSLAVSSGFVLLFGAAGVVVAAGGHALLGAMPWVGLSIGVVLGVLGLWMLAGQSLYASFFQRIAGRLGSPKVATPKGFFLFGLGYGAASLSCTLPVFLLVVGNGIAAGGFLPAMSRFMGYALGMASVIVTLTLALALFKGGLVAWFGRIVPHVRLASAVLLLGAGVYLILYWLTRLDQAAPFG